MHFAPQKMLGSMLHGPLMLSAELYPSFKTLKIENVKTLINYPLKHFPTTPQSIISITAYLIDYTV